MLADRSCCACWHRPRGWCGRLPRRMPRPRSSSAVEPEDRNASRATLGRRFPHRILVPITGEQDRVALGQLRGRVDSVAAKLAAGMIIDDAGDGKTKVV